MLSLITMPRKNRKKNHLIVKQKRLIATRLLQISLLVDDYLYQHKPMSVRSAEAYIKEIAGYADKLSHQDARSLQVIEKLTRCMKGIIYEQQEMNSEGAADIYSPCENKVNDANMTLSPVYSVIDEDLTQIPQSFEVDNHIRLMIEERTSNLVIDNDLGKEAEGIAEQVHLSMQAIETKPNNNANTVQNKDAPGAILDIEGEVIDLCDKDIDELTQAHNNFHHEPELSIQNAISNLSIRDINEAFTPISQQCSQSILDPFYTQNIDHIDALNLPINNYDDSIRETAVSPTKEVITFKHGPTKIVLPTKKQNVKASSNYKNKPIIQSNKIMTEQIKDHSRISINASRKQTKRNRKLSDINENKCIKTKTIKPRATATNNKLQVNKEPNIKASILPKACTNENEASMQYQFNKKAHTFQSHIPASTSKVNNSVSQNTVLKPNKTYKSYVQDLSWIENIRYVREIQLEEFEPPMDEGFWENCTLPETFNEDDFNY